ncbi:MAG TPA: PHB depolymerase family esterase, partial [Acidimicrobiales bacterium]|nr:PHB depolymerase family esterase [Acidimicrobiales bacterium]
MTAPGLRWRAGTELVAVLTLVLALVTVGSNRPAEARATRSSQAAAPESRGTVVTGSMRWDGVSRTYRVFVPTSYTAGTPTPLVVGLHGGFGSGRQFERDNGLKPALAERAMLGVFPDGVAGPLTGIRTWNAGNCCAYSMNTDVDDVGFIDALVKRLRRQYTVDPARIYAIGHSNGGMLSFRLGCDLPGVFAPIPPVAGALDDTPRCQPGHRL